MSGPAGFVVYRTYQPFSFLQLKRQAFAGGGGEHQSVDRTRRIMPDQPPQRRLVEFAIAKRVISGSQRPRSEV